MMTKNTSFDAVEHFSEKHANIYDDKIQKVILGYKQMHELAYYILKDNLENRASILISGIGTGHEAITYAEPQKEWSIYGVDPSEEMVRNAQQKIQHKSLSQQIDVFHGTVNDIQKNNFDAATSILVMQFLEDNGDKEAYLSNIFNKLKVGAKFILIDIEGDKNSEEYRFLLSAWKCHQYSTRNNKEQIDKDFDHVSSDVQSISAERIHELLYKVGFSKTYKFYKSLLFGGYVAEKL